MSSSVAPAPAILTPKEVLGALRDLTQAVQEIHLFLTGSYGPHPAVPPIAATAPPWLLWQPPHQEASAALAGSHPAAPPIAATAPPWLPPHQAASAALAGSHPAAPPIAATAPPWLPWLPPHQAASAALAGPLRSCHPPPPPPRPGCSGSRRSWRPLPRPALRYSSPCRCPARHRSSRCSCSSHRRYVAPS
nr:atherin-like [Aegilops tauschii subsp. strangulata]